MDHWGLNVNKVYINDDPGLILTYLTARSNLVKIAYCGGCQVSVYSSGFTFYRLGNAAILPTRELSPQSMIFVLFIEPDERAGEKKLDCTVYFMVK